MKNENQFTLTPLVKAASGTVVTVNVKTATKIEGKVAPAERSKQTINLASNVKAETVTDYSSGVIKDVMKTAGLDSIKITSTSRTPAEQAEIMYGNIVTHGVDAQKKLYGASGDKVVDEYSNALTSKKNKEEIISAMGDKIVSIHENTPNAFKHVSDPNVLNVIDIAPSSIPSDKQKSFKEAINGESRIKKAFFPPTDPAFHIEIEQPEVK